MEINVVAPQKAWNRSTSQSSWHIPKHILKGLPIFLERHLLIHVHCCSIYNNQILGIAQMPINCSMDDENVVYLHKEFYSAIKKNKLRKFACE